MEESKLVNGRMLPGAASVAEYAVRAMARGDVVAVPGVRNKILATSIRFTPRPVARRMVMKLQEARSSDAQTRMIVSPGTST